MLKRKAYQKLLDWKKDRNHKALCIFGARQIGKTTLIRKFGKENYKNFVEINFISDTDAAGIFSGDLDVNTIITNLTAYTRQPMEPGETLVFFDEVQECPNVRTAIKFLVEDRRFDYIESGSLLGTKYKTVKSLPVGFEEIYRMYPMDFEEFLWANGVQDATIQYLKTCMHTKMQVLPAVHETMTKLFYSYIVVGGMPDVVQTYVDTHDIGKVIAVQTSLLDLYRQDISRYADGNEKIKIKAIFDAIPSQLNDKNRRFMVNSLAPTARLARYEDSFQWLSDAGVALACYNVTEPQTPLKLNEKHSLFKLFMNDVGLLCAACMENVQFDLLSGHLDVNLGSILENIVAQQLKANGYDLFYFDAKKYGEVDFVVSGGVHTRLIEVKSGNDYHKHSALDKIRSVSEWTFRDSIVLCKGNLEASDDVLYLPWYMMIFVCPDAPPQGLIYEVDLSALNGIYPNQ